MNKSALSKVLVPLIIVTVTTAGTLFFYLGDITGRYPTARLLFVGGMVDKNLVHYLGWVGYVPAALFSGLCLAIAVGLLLKDDYRISEDREHTLHRNGVDTPELDHLHYAVQSLPVAMRGLPAFLKSRGVSSKTPAMKIIVTSRQPTSEQVRWARSLGV